MVQNGPARPTLWLNFKTIKFAIIGQIFSAQRVRKARNARLLLALGKVKAGGGREATALAGSLVMLAVVLLCGFGPGESP